MTNSCVKQYGISETDVEAEAQAIFGDLSALPAKYTGCRLDPAKLEEGAFLSGTVVDIRDTLILVDIGGKSEGLLPFKESDRVNNDLDVGDVINVSISEITDTEEVKLTRDGIEVIEKHMSLLPTFVPGTKVLAKLKEMNKDGWTVDIGTEAFLPRNLSYLTPSDLADRNTLIEVEIDFIKNNQVFLSRKSVAEDRKKSAKENFLMNLQVGDVVNGTVKNITDFGLFIQIAAGVIGLCHASDMGATPVTTGQVTPVKILKFDKDRARVSLGIRQVSQPSWGQILEKYHVGQSVVGTVKSLAPYGAFIEVEPGVEGLLHISDMSWSDHIKNPEDFTAVGQELQLLILELDEEKGRLALGAKQLVPDPWDLVTEKYLAGNHYAGVISNKTHFGVFVELEKGIEGLIKNTSKDSKLQLQQPVRVSVTKVDARNKKIYLTLS